MTIPALRKSRFATALLALLLVTYLLPRQTNSQGTASGACKPEENNIKYAMYFQSRPKDTPECSMTVKDGKIVFGASISNPALTCPDAFAWKLLAEAVTQEFWLKWAADQYTWPGVQCDKEDKNCVPSNPYPLCGTPGATPGKCCDPASKANPGYEDPNPAKHCPYFPGDHLDSRAATASMPLRTAGPPSKAHLVSFAAASLDPGRDIRQSMAELVFRNKPMFDYVFRNDLYNQEGVAAVFKRNSDNLNNDAPYRLQRISGALAEIDFPVSSVMIKSNWIDAGHARQIGLRDDPANPYIKMNIQTPVTDNNQKVFVTGEHWLVALHLSSKDTPNWVWATFEHVRNPGRCDYTGCNDSYGYRSSDSIGQTQASNYTQPRIKCDGLPLAGWVFDTGKEYPSGPASASFKGVFSGLGIGTGSNTNLTPTRADKAWLSYRLKGSQTEFTDPMGRATRIGNSVTEAGFMNSSSCISCHARAGAGPDGPFLTSGPPVLGVFLNELSDSGYNLSANGLPAPNWYHRSGQPPTLIVLQTDFVWGFLFAHSLKSSESLTTARSKIR